MIIIVIIIIILTLMDFFHWNEQNSEVRWATVILLAPFWSTEKYSH